MFKVNSSTDRLNYGEILMPPIGFTLDSAIGTTYSLDLETLTAIAISLGLSEETDSALLSNPVCMLNALQRVSDKILIFCEAGQIKMPNSPSTLFLLLEKMVYQVALPMDKSSKSYPAFHPKTWLLSYVNDAGEKKYRFVVLSRNLTFDRSWDISVVLDGSKGSEGNGSTEPIRDFLGYLDGQISQGYAAENQKRQLIEQAAEDLDGVKFSLDSREFSSFEILPLGIGEKGYDIQSDSLWKDNFHEILIMSPFVTGSVIEHYNASKLSLSNAKRTLITRKSALSDLTHEETENFDVYTLRDEIQDGENELSEGAEEQEGGTEGVQRQDIHAKIYLRRKGSDVDLYLGSMNATYSAMNRNVELLLKLRTKNRYLNTELFLKDLFGNDEKENPFEQIKDIVPAVPESADVLDRLENKIKKLCRSKGRAHIEKTDDRFRLKIRFVLVEPMENVTISPFRISRSEAVDRQVVFEDLEELQLSEFYRVTATEGDYTVERVVMIPTFNLPKDRDKAVVKSVVKDKESFVEYVTFVLGDDYVASFLDITKAHETAIQNKSSWAQVLPAVYERMLKTALEHPEKLKEIQTLLKMIDDKEIVPDEFRQMFETFQRAVK